MEELTNELVRLSRSMERGTDLPPLPTPSTWTDGKQRHREALKKMAMGQKPSHDQNREQRGILHSFSFSYFLCDSVPVKNSKNGIYPAVR